MDGSFSQSENSTNETHLRAPYLIYFGSVNDRSFAKTGLGLVQWRKDECVGAFRHEGSALQSGLPDLSIEEAVKSGARSLIIGVASIGGTLPDSWLKDLVAAAEAGLDIVSGMHMRLADVPGLAEAASRSGARLIDVRVPPAKLPIGTGRKRTGRRLLTVGTDCAVGKKYTALAIEKELLARGVNADFRATGQTGIMIAGRGIPIDSVVADFLAGAAEVLSPDAEPNHWDLVEGQGALSHPSYAGVSLGLLHGSQPDALVLCHDASRDRLHTVQDGLNFPIVPFNDAMRCALELARRVNEAARFVGVSVNTSEIDPSKREALLQEIERETGLPAIDPIIDGAGKIVDRLLSEFPQ